MNSPTVSCATLSSSVIAATSFDTRAARGSVWSYHGNFGGGGGGEGAGVHMLVELQAADAMHAVSVAETLQMMSRCVCPWPDAAAAAAAGPSPRVGRTLRPAPRCLPRGARRRLKTPPVAAA